VYPKTSKYSSPSILQSPEDYPKQTQRIFEHDEKHLAIAK